MKVILKNKNIALIALLWCTAFYNCSSDDTQATEFSMTISPDNYTANFYEEGQTAPIQINSNIGEPEVISILGSPNDFFDYNETTNSITWSKGLPLGETTVIVKAEKNNNEAISAFTIENEFKTARFSGGFNNNPDISDSFNVDIEVLFNEGNEAEVILDGSPTILPGLWTIENNTINFYFGWFTSPDEIRYQFTGTLVYTANENPVISGYLYYYLQSEITPSGFFEITLIEE